LVYSLWALLGVGAVTLLWGAALLLAGLPLLLWQRRRAATAIRH
jgi:APA family basic amino acid/polyamine antiporter